MPLFNWTGNPWVDAGIAAIMEWQQKASPENITKEDLLKMKEDMMSLFLTDGWKSSNFTIFVNYPTNNPSNKGNEIPKLNEFFGNMMKNVEPLGKEGNCISCGRRPASGNKTRQHVPMTGSGKMRNYFSYAVDGADYCETCTLAIQSMPLVCYGCGGKVILLHSSCEKVMKYWSRRCIENIHKQQALKNIEGCFNEGYTNPINALFHITQDLILTYEERWQEENAQIRIYNFTNYIAKPAEINIYDLPAPVFRFLAYIRPHPKYRDWLKVIRKGYGKDVTGKPESEYRNYKNSVYQKLLNGNSIVGYFLNNKAKMAIGDWSLLKYYLKEVRKMEEKRIEAIRKLGDEAAEIIKTSPNGKKRLGQLERAESYASLRNVLLRLMRDRVALKEETPLFTYEDYVESFFPEGIMNWRETQDLLLFRLYEVLHQWLISEGIVEVEEESEEVTVS